MRLATRQASSHNMAMISAEAATHLSAVAFYLTIGLIVLFVILAGIVSAWGRGRLEGSFKERSGSAPGDSESPGGSSADRTFMRSWLAISLVGGLLVFCAASFELDDTALRSSLLGGVIASAGAATAFYFASKSSDQARRDILNASFPSTTTPNLLDRTRAEVNSALAGSPLYLDGSPATAPDDWFAVSQYPQANQPTPTGSRVQVVFAGRVPDLSNLSRSAAEAELAKCNLTLSPQPADATPDSIAQADQKPIAGSPPPRDRVVTVTFQPAPTLRP